jgi:ribonuclease BN (tRNA processing enzyme)
VLDIGTLQIRFNEVPHFTRTFAVGICSTNGGGRFTYGADSAPNDALVRFADGADLLIIEATLPRPEREGPRGHLTPSEAGEHGLRARVGRLVITHISDELDERWARAEAEQAFGGPVVVAREGAVYTV